MYHDKATFSLHVTPDIDSLSLWDIDSVLFVQEIAYDEDRRLRSDSSEFRIAAKLQSTPRHQPARYSSQYLWLRCRGEVVSTGIASAAGLASPAGGGRVALVDRGGGTLLVGGKRTPRADVLLHADLRRFVPS